MLLTSVQTGTPRTYGTEGSDDPLERPWTSAIAKQPITGPVWAGRMGMAGDVQADRKHHGGPDQAVLGYSADHYPRWREELARLEVGPGWFGENLTVSGVTERSACIGDIVAVGAARLEVTQPRQPCGTLSRRFQRRDMVKLVHAAQRYGWYLRVLREGWVEAGMEVTLEDRPYPQWPVWLATEVLEHRSARREEALRLAACPALSAKWRNTLGAA
jgi:MOSC domain-containing protein YiiM